MKPLLQRAFPKPEDPFCIVNPLLKHGQVSITRFFHETTALASRKFTHPEHPKTSKPYIPRTRKPILKPPGSCGLQASGSPPSWPPKDFGDILAFRVRGFSFKV